MLCANKVWNKKGYLGKIYGTTLHTSANVEHIFFDLAWMSQFGMMTTSRGSLEPMQRMSSAGSWHMLKTSTSGNLLQPRSSSTYCPLHIGLEFGWLGMMGMECEWSFFFWTKTNFNLGTHINQYPLTLIDTKCIGTSLNLNLNSFSWAKHVC